MPLRKNFNVWWRHWKYPLTFLGQKDRASFITFLVGWNLISSKSFQPKKIAALSFLKSVLESCSPTFQHKEKNFSNQMHQNQKQWWWWWLWWRVKRQILSWFFAIQRKAEWRGGGEATNTKTTSKFFKPWFYTIANTNTNTGTRRT